MTMNPTFQAPTAEGMPDPSPFIEVDTALESMRDSGFDFTAALGEPTDNSVEAGASIIRIVPKYSVDKKQIVEIAFADNGRGIDLATLPQVLKMGFSSRYGQRKGLGRFGVGLKLAGLAVGRRIEVITKAEHSDKFYRVFIDLDMIKDGSQVAIHADEIDGWPAGYEHLMEDAQGVPFSSGTLVLWQKIDRLSSGGRFGSSLNSKVSDMLKYLGRTYREFLDKGLTIEFDGRPVQLHDPLFLLDNPRIEKKYAKNSKVKPEQLKGTVVDEDDLEIDGHKVHVRVTIAPEYFRHKSGFGGDRDAEERDISEFQIKDNEGRISMLRNGREVYYDIVPRLLPSGVQTGDRYIGIEVAFPAELDEYFQVRNVKHGAVPVNKLRDDLRVWLKRTVLLARKQVRNHWNEVKVAEQRESSDGRPPGVLDAIERSEKTSPQGRAGRDLSDKDEADKIEEILEDLDLADEDDKEAADKLRAAIAERPVMILDGNWPGKELMAIDHLNGKFVLRLNHRHPFIRDIYDALRDAAATMPADLDLDDLHGLIGRTSMALDALFVAYAKAENMHEDPEVFEDLRSYWGQHTQAYMRELAKEEG